MAWRVARLWAAGLVILVTDFPAPLAGLQAADAPIGVITRGSPDLVLPASSTDGLPTRYGLGFPVQLGPRTAGLFCNLRVVGVGRTDYEDGTDVFVFGDAGNVAKAGPTPISRNEKEKDAVTGEARFIVKYPAVGGFWPLEARQPDGSAHPGAGKGFALCQALSLVGAGDKLTWDMFSLPSLRCYVEVMQLSFDGRKVAVVKRDLIRTGRGWATRDGWGLTTGGIQAAIPDGPDLLDRCSPHGRQAVGHVESGRRPRHGRLAFPVEKARCARRRDHDRPVDRLAE